MSLSKIWIDYEIGGMILPGEDSESNVPHCRRVHRKRLGANPCLRSGMPAPTGLSRGTALQIQEFNPEVRNVAVAFVTDVSQNSTFGMSN